MRPMARNPLEDVARGLRVLGDRLAQGGSDPGDWIADQLDSLRRPGAGTDAGRAPGRARLV